MVVESDLVWNLPYVKLVLGGGCLAQDVFSSRCSTHQINVSTPLKTPIKAPIKAPNQGTRNPHTNNRLQLKAGCKTP